MSPKGGDEWTWAIENEEREERTQEINSREGEREREIECAVF
jgi:hypothetical protein